MGPTVSANIIAHASFPIIGNNGLTAQLTNAAGATQWKRWTVCLGILLPVAPYEVMFILWVNDRIDKMEAM
jgi:hypothetical protein